MEVQYTKSKEYRVAAAANLQFPVEEELNLDQHLPDLEAVIGQHLQFVLGQVTKGDGKVCIQGELQYQILYATAKGERPIMGLRGEIAVSQCIMMDYDASCEVSVDVSISSVSIKRMNTRKLSAFILLDAKAVATQIQERQFIEDIEMEAQKQLGTIKSNELVSAGKLPASIKDVISLPSNRPDIGRILFERVQVRAVELQNTEGAIWMKGEAFLFLIYESGQEDPRTEYLELISPIETQVECRDCSGSLATISDYHVLTATVSEAPNEDGEVRDLHLNIEMEINYQQFQEIDFSYLKDAYSLTQKMNLTYEDMAFKRVLNRRMERVKLADFFHPQGDDRLLMVYPMGASVVLSEPEVVTSGVLVEGTVLVDVAYLLTEHGQYPMMSQMMIPFHQQLNVTEVTDEIAGEIHVHVQADIAQLSAGILDGTQAEIKAVLNLNAVVSHKGQCSVMNEITVEPLEPVKRPGMIGYVIGANDTLWDIAKENRTTVEAIQQVNELSSQEVTEGMRLLVCQM